MEKSVILGGRTFTSEFVGELRQHLEAEPASSAKSLAEIICHRLAWYSCNGQLAVMSARSALRKLRRRGLLPQAPLWPQVRRAHRLKASGAPLPPVCGVPRRVDAVRGLHLYLLRDHED